MNSEERKTARYLRRKAKRKTKQVNVNFEEIFTFKNLWIARQKTMKNVGWKASVQAYRNRSITNIAKTYHELHSGKYKSRGFYEFDIIERGKPRHIQSVHISERVVQRCLCDIALVPIIKRQLIYDNGACLKGKGIDFSLNRMETHLKTYYLEHGNNEGYALMIDFSKYFENIDHGKLIQALTNIIKDKKLLGLLVQLINDFGEKGLGLGSQISQISAIFLPTSIDRFVLKTLGVKRYGRYMDDSYLIHESKEYLRQCLISIRSIADMLGIKLNSKKTQIVKLKNGIPWLKTRFILTSSGKVYRKPHKKSIVRMRRKLKIFKRWQDLGKMHKIDIFTSYNSWKGHIEKTDSVQSVRSMDRLYFKLFSQGA